MGNIKILARSNHGICFVFDHLFVLYFERLQLHPKQRHKKFVRRVCSTKGSKLSAVLAIFYLQWAISKSLQDQTMEFVLYLIICLYCISKGCNCIPNSAIRNSCEEFAAPRVPNYLQCWPYSICSGQYQNPCKIKPWNLFCI